MSSANCPPLESMDDQPKIRVVIRKRPLNKKQLSKSETDVVEVSNGADVKVREHKLKVDLTKYIEQHMFKFDSAFSEQINNQQLYQECVRPIVQCAFLGAKVTCFAYGQTGSGKTYTMNGDLENNCPGMYYLGAEDIFALRDQGYQHLTISVSFFEIYCGKLFDLLNNREQLQAREDGKQNVNIIGLSIKNISTIEQFMQTIAYGSSVRITSQNSTNSDSSRSHAILQISLMNCKKLYGKISFIDLAGCERGADTLDQNKQTKIDGAQINKSLLALKQCIRALDQGKNHTPFRGSKLTMVLKDSFTGFCRTLMIGNVSPGSGSCENTLNTLRYADRVKELKKEGGGGTEMSKEERQARELMLPRSQKNKQIIIKNQDDSDEEIIISSPMMGVGSGVASAVGTGPIHGIQEKNMNYQPKSQLQPQSQTQSQSQPHPQAQLQQQGQKKLKYIQQRQEQQQSIPTHPNQSYKKKSNLPSTNPQLPDKPKQANNNQRKGVMNTGHSNANPNQNHNPKSVAHTNLVEKSEQNSRVRDTRNKSVLNMHKVDLKGVQKSSYGLNKKGAKEPITERNSFTQNYSVVNLHDKYKQIIGESQKIKSNTLANNSQINLFNRYSKKDRVDSVPTKSPDTTANMNSQSGVSNNASLHNMSKIKTEMSEEPCQQLTADQKQWQSILRRFRVWKPSRAQFEEMSVLFEELVKLIMREELEISQMHKKLLIAEERMLKDSLNLYNEVQRESKNNEEMMEYTGRLSKHITERVRCFNGLKSRIEMYQYHLKEHESCEAKLIEAGEASAFGYGNLDGGDMGLWNE